MQEMDKLTNDTIPEGYRLTKIFQLFFFFSPSILDLKNAFLLLISWANFALYTTLQFIPSSPFRIPVKSRLTLVKVENASAFCFAS